MKMKASELRIRNWVKTLEDGSTHFRQVTGIEIASENQRIDGFTRPFVRCGHMAAILNDEDIEYISPIPLTPEILEKAGFKKIYHEDFSDSFILNVSTEGVIKWEDDGSILINDRLDDGIGYATNCVCKYVHQLQNLIHSLTGQELTINL
jgi:hypothetical protein